MAVMDTNSEMFDTKIFKATNIYIAGGNYVSSGRNYTVGKNAWLTRVICIDRAN